MIKEIPLEKFCQIKHVEEKFPNTKIQDYVVEKEEQSPFTKVWILEKKGEVLAFLMLDIIYERMELLQLEVREEYQNQGYASNLIEFMLALGTREGIENITLEVREDNEKAIHLYQKYGFQKCAVRKGYYQGKDAILMERKMM